ncbi:DUF4433 domain-containing protein [Sphingomonas sp. Leaf4]|uniref:DUF4433 domain-containing protein n=1 Tax=Sphingomonas sp. Leaf4 TaxID=2876553 RepID=UPI0022A65E68|nr:DarT ssDNA thymidine ADP-ribosyltransferase family protein [Sphingomonas sp. Leaf4]
MPIPVEHVHRHLYHFTHIDNLPGLLRTGFLANNHPAFPAHRRSIAAATIQARRAAMVVPCGPGGRVHDYVPLYFGSLSPMLLMVLLSKNVDQRDIVYFEFPISLLLRPSVVFTDAGANTDLPPGFYTDPVQLGQLDWGAIDARTWSERDPNRKNRRMAEALVHTALPLTDAVRIIGFDANARHRIGVMVAEAGLNQPPITLEDRYQRQHYIRAFDNSGISAVFGPNEIAERFEAACASVEAARGAARPAPPYARPEDLLAALRANFGCVPQTAELVGLASDNGMHKHTVDIHTCEVVDKLLQLPGFRALSGEHQTLVELAAYLHDIGKGPKARWAFNNGVQRVDTNHPVGAMPMMVDILTRQVGWISPQAVRRLMKLVCYHDLVGDILGRNRDEQQLIDILDDETDLDMLIAIGQADASALQEAWNITFTLQSAGLRQRCAAAIRAKV